MKEIASKKEKESIVPVSKSVQKIIEVKNLSTWFPVSHSVIDFISRKPQRYLKAVNNVSLEIFKGESLGLVGESGCGKSTLAKSIVRLYEPIEGEILLKGKDIAHMKGEQLRKIRSAMQMIFQDPYSSLNPRMSVYDTLAEMLHVHKIVLKHKMREYIGELLEMCGLSMDIADRFPGEFSGGQRQRIGIARSLALNPEFILADEPVSALDVSIQAQIINLLSSLQKKLHLTILFISHDLRVVRYITHRVAVMYLGKLVEKGATELVFQRPLHPYTFILTRAAPILDPTNRLRDYVIEGEPPSPVDVPSGCKFHPRCTYCKPLCRTREPVLREIEARRYVACHYPLVSENE